MGLLNTAARLLENDRALKQQFAAAVESGEREFMPLDHHMRAKTFIAKRCEEIIAESTPPTSTTMPKYAFD